MKAKFKKIYQIGIIVRDVDSCVKRFEEDYGMGPWEVSVMSNELPYLKDMTIDGKLSDFKIKSGMLKAFGMEIELIEPLSDSAYKEWLDKHGPGIHHVAFALEDGQYEKLLFDTEKSTGKEPWIRGQAAGIGMDFAYLDLREQLGLIVECDSQHEDKHPGHDY